MPRQVAARVLLVCAVLLAQHSAFAHGLWHVLGAATASEDGKPAKGKPLCDLHDLLGTVLGAVSAAAPSADLLAFSDVAFVPAACPAVRSRCLVPCSRGPPLRS